MKRHSDLDVTIIQRLFILYPLFDKVFCKKHSNVDCCDISSWVVIDSERKKRSNEPVVVGEP